MIMTNGTLIPFRSNASSRARPFILGCLLVAGIAATNVAHAKTFAVNSPADGVDAQRGDGVCETAVGNGGCTLRAAIQEANASGGLDTINLPAGLGEYVLSLGGAGEDLSATGDLDISDSLSIVGTGGNRDQIIINGNGSDRVMHILSGATVSLSTLTLKGGLARSTVGGGIYLENGKLTIENSVISDNRAHNPDEIANGGNGGGIYVTNDSTLRITGSTLSGNISDTKAKGIGGGGIFNAGKLDIEDSVLDANSAINSPSAAGGALHNLGGAGLDPNVARVLIVRSTISRNSANVGGGIRNLYGAITMDGVTISDNQASNSGGGIENSGGGMIVERASIHGNFANNTGGGIANFDALDLSHSAVYNNSVDQALNASAGQGGGLYNSGQGRLDLLNTTITLNAAQEGGGLYNHRAANIINSTIYNNTSTKDGSEIVACGTKDEAQGKGCLNDSSQVETDILNTIVGNSTGVPACSGDVSLFTSKGHNIDLGTSCGFNQTGDQSNIPVSELFVGSAANNDGESPNYAIRADSAAHNRGDNTKCPIIDQRSYSRDTACDIGAFEISNSKNPGFELVDLKVDVTSNSAAQGGSGQITFTVTVTNKGPSQATNVVLTGKLPPWALPESNGISTTNGGTCSVTSDGFTCNLGTINAYTFAQIYVVVFPKQAGDLVLDVDVTSDQVDIFRPDSTTSSVTAANPGTSTGTGGNGVVGNFSGKSGSVDWSWGVLLLIPFLRRYAQRL